MKFVYSMSVKDRCTILMVSYIKEKHLCDYGLQDELASFHFNWKNGKVYLLDIWQIFSQI